MSNSAAIDLDKLVNECLAALPEESDNSVPAAETTMRERFFEFMVVILGNLYTKTPIAGALFDRSTMLRVTAGMEDGEAGKLTGRTEDWMRLEGLLRQQDGTKNYFLTRQTMAVLSTLTAAGTLGDVFDAVLARYGHSMPTANIRSTTRLLGSYFLTRLARS